MKNLRILGVIVVLVVLLGIFAAVKGFLATSQTNKEDQNAPLEGEMLSGSGDYTLVPGESEVRWAGHKRLIPGYTDHGRIPLKSGALTVEEGDITNIDIVFDIAGIHATSTSIATPEGLTSHLRSEDFFNAGEFPEARLTVTEIRRGVPGVDLVLVGDLTIKDQTHEVEVPADVRVQEDGRLLAQGEFSIDRTRWGITYGSGSFFQDLGDQVIANEVDISFDAVFIPAENE